VSVTSLHLADLQQGESVVDLGSGSGTGTFVAALQVDKSRKVVGVDVTDEQRSKAERLRDEAGFGNVTHLKGYIEGLPCENASFDAVIGNGVINVCADKAKVFREVARVLKSGGRLALSDIVTETQLPDSITCSATLWTAYIGGAMQQEDYRTAIESAGLRVKRVKRVQDDPQYLFVSDNALGTSKKTGVKSISLLAVKP